jgi:hypothetical protein
MIELSGEFVIERVGEDTEDLERAGEDTED